jgi:hypothetical protein
MAKILGTPLLPPQGLENEVSDGGGGVGLPIDTKINNLIKMLQF